MRLPLFRKGAKTIDSYLPGTEELSTQWHFRRRTTCTDIYIFLNKGSFFLQTIRDRNALPLSVIFSAENAEDCHFC